MKTLKLTMVAIAVAFSTSTIADDNIKESGFFTTLGGSYVSLDGACQDAQALADAENLDVSSCSDSELGFDFSGGYRFNEFFAAEVKAIFVGGFLSDGFHVAFDNQNGDTFKADIEYRSFALGGQGRYPLGDKFSLIGRVGIHAWDADGSLSVNGVDANIRANDSGTDPYFGIGGSMQISSDVRIDIGYTRYKADGDNVDEIAFSLGTDF